MFTEVEEEVFKTKTLQNKQKNRVFMAAGEEETKKQQNQMFLVTKIHKNLVFMEVEGGDKTALLQDWIAYYVKKNLSLCQDKDRRCHQSLKKNKRRLFIIHKEQIQENRVFMEVEEETEQIKDNQLSVKRWKNHPRHLSLDLFDRELKQIQQRKVIIIQLTQVMDLNITQLMILIRWN